MAGRAKKATHPTEVAGRDTKGNRRPADDRFLTDAELVSKSGSFGNYVTEVRIHGQEELVTTDVGTIVVATGFDSYEPEAGEFGYGIEGVLTLPDFMTLVDGSDGPLTYQGKRVKTIAYVYCVGNRQPAGGNEYCSKFCCSATVHASITIAARDAGVHQYHLHRDIRTYGKYELMYTESRERGSVYLRFPDDTPPTVARTEDGHVVADVDGIVARKLGRTWRVWLGAGWRSPTLTK